MTGPERLWLNLNHADQQRHGVSFVTKGPANGPPYTKYVRADVVEQLVAAAYEDAAEKCAQAFATHVTEAIYGEAGNAARREAAANMAEYLLHQIQARTPDDAKAALERVKQEARNEALREAAQSAFDCQNPFLAPSARIAVRDSILAIIEKDATDG